MKTLIIYCSRISKRLNSRKYCPPFSHMPLHAPFHFFHMKRHIGQGSHRHRHWVILLLTEPQIEAPVASWTWGLRRGQAARARSGKSTKKLIRVEKVCPPVSPQGTPVGETEEALHWGLQWGHQGWECKDVSEHGQPEGPESLTATPLRDWNILSVPQVW